MNEEKKIHKLFNNMSDEELKQAVVEIQVDGITGVVRSDGIVRKYAKLISEITNNSLSMPMLMAGAEICYQVVCRGVKLNNKHESTK